MSDFKPGDRVMMETDNNGPIHRGEIVAIGPRFVSVRWDDGMTTPQSPDNLQRDH